MPQLPWTPRPRSECGCNVNASSWRRMKPNCNARKNHRRFSGFVTLSNQGREEPASRPISNGCDSLAPRVQRRGAQGAIYDDGGFSGGSMERPALQKLLLEVQA